MKQNILRSLELLRKRILRERKQHSRTSPDYRHLTEELDKCRDMESLTELLFEPAETT
jgi:hypothetical protein